MQVEATLKETKWHDLTHWGIRAALGITFLVHSLKKFDPTWQGWLVETAGQRRRRPRPGWRYRRAP